MEDIKVAYKLRGLFEQKITNEYYASFKGSFGRVQVEVLSYLYEKDRAHVQDIADTINISKQHASKIIRKFEEDGLLDNSPDPSDGRSTVYHLNEKGRALMDEHLSLSDERFLTKLNSLAPADRKELIECMVKIAKQLENI